MSQLLDSVDTKILACLQEDGRQSSQELAERVGLSPSQCARRRQRLEESGYVIGYRAVIDQTKAGAEVSAFVQITMAAHTRENARDFIAVVRRTPEIIDVWTLTGEADYLLRVAVANLSGLNKLIQEVLLPHPAVARVQSRIVMEHLKRNAPVPVFARRG